MSWIQSIWKDLDANLPQRMSFGGRAFKVLWGLVFSQGFQLCLLYRCYSAIFSWPLLGRPFARLLANFSTTLFSSQIHPEARIDGGLALPHPVGIIIGQGSLVQSDVQIYQHVTIGVSRTAESGYPTIGRGATIFAGAVIVGPLRVGAGAVVGANSVVLQHVPEGAVAVGVPARIVVREGEDGALIRSSPLS